MNHRNKIIFYIAIIVYLFILYRNSWFPGSNLLYSKEPYFILLFTVPLIVMLIDFSLILNTSLNMRSIEMKLIIFAILILLGSILIYNNQEFRKLYNISRFFSFVTYFLLYFYLLPRFLMSERVYFSKLIKYISSLGFILSLIGLLIFFGGFKPIPKYDFTVLSIIVHPNYLPPVLIMGIFATLYISYSKTVISRLENYFLVFSILLQSITVLFTYSRNGILAMLIGYTFFFAMKYRAKIIFLLPLPLILTPLMIGFFSAKGFASLASRLYLLFPAYQMISESKQRFYWGYGITNAFDTYEKYKVYSNVLEENINNPHNSFISLILMCGLFFFILIGILMIVLFSKSLLRYIKNKTNEANVLYTFLISVSIALLCLGLFESQLVMPEFLNIQPFLIFTGLLYCLNSKTNLSINLHYQT